MHKAQEIHIQIPSGTIVALSWGPTNGKPILALHGWLDNAASFIPIAKYFKEFRFVALDLIGHGFSSHPPRGAYFHYIDYIADVASVIDQMGWETCSLLGHSLGAGIATILTGTIPERIKTLGLIDGLGPITMDIQQLPDMLHKSLRDYSRLAQKNLPIYKEESEAIQARLSATKMLKSSVELLVTRGLKKVAGGYTWSTDPRLMCSPLIMYSEEQITPFLERIKQETCLIRPSHGFPFDEKMFTTRVQYLDNIEVHKVKGEHHVHMDHPDVVGPILQEFFTRNI